MPPKINDVNLANPSDLGISLGNAFFLVAAMPFNAYFNGDIVSLNSPVLQTNDLGLLRGYGLFDYFRTYNGQPFRWDDYWQRFENSARVLHLDIPVSKTEAADIVAQLYRQSDQAEVAFRFVLTGGYAADSVTVTAPNLLIRCEQLPSDNPAGRLAGIKVLPYEYVRDLPMLKSTNYVHMVMMAQEMKRQGAADLLFHKEGEISELTRSNVFIIKDNRLITPDRNVLFGITRQTVLELAEADFEVEVRPVLFDEVLHADEAFTTSTTKWVMPIVQVGDKAIGSGQIGPKTRQLQLTLEAFLAGWGR